LSVLTLILIGWAMTRTALQAFDYGDRKLELQLPVYVLWIAALLGLAGTMLCALGAFLLPPTASDEPPAA
jgi:TRAP-type transport system small permease protein